MKFIIYQDAKGEWRWRLKSRNGKTVADSGEGYKRRGAVVNILRNIRFQVPHAPVEDAS